MLSLSKGALLAFLPALIFFGLYTKKRFVLIILAAVFIMGLFSPLFYDSSLLYHHTFYGHAHQISSNANRFIICIKRQRQDCTCQYCRYEGSDFHYIFPVNYVCQLSPESVHPLPHNAQELLFLVL